MPWALQGGAGGDADELQAEKDTEEERGLDRERYRSLWRRAGGAGADGSPRPDAAAGSGGDDSPTESGVRAATRQVALHDPSASAQ